MSENESYHRMRINVPVKKPNDIEDYAENNTNKDVKSQKFPESNKNDVVENSQINEEHSNISEIPVINQESSSIIDIELIELDDDKKLETKETQPRFAIGHSLSNILLFYY
jgi:hypothetical protein